MILVTMAAPPQMMFYVNRCPHKDRSATVCVCLCPRDGQCKLFKEDPNCLTPTSSCLHPLPPQDNSIVNNHFMSKLMRSISHQQRVSGSFHTWMTVKSQMKMKRVKGSYFSEFRTKKSRDLRLKSQLGEIIV